MVVDEERLQFKITSEDKGPLSKSCIWIDEARRSMGYPHSQKLLESDLPHFLLQVKEQPLEFSGLRKDTVGGIPCFVHLFMWQLKGGG